MPETHGAGKLTPPLACHRIRPGAATVEVDAVLEAARQLIFRFGRRKKIEARARSIARLMWLTIGGARSMPLEQLIEANRRRGFVEADIDRANRTYAFFEGEIAKADFGFGVDYGSNDAPVVSGQGYGDYFGIYLTATKLGEVSIEYREQDARGRDAQALQSALLKLPGFSTWRAALKSRS